MSNLEMIETLCGIVEEETALLCKLAMRLEEVGAITEAEKEAVEAARRKYTELLGCGEKSDAEESENA